MDVSLIEANCFGADGIALLEPLLPALAPPVALLGAFWLFSRGRALRARPR